jgi:hypothetical protein
MLRFVDSCLLSEFLRSPTEDMKKEFPWSSWLGIKSSLTWMILKPFSRMAFHVVLVLWLLDV